MIHRSQNPENASDSLERIEDQSTECKTVNLRYCHQTRVTEMYKLQISIFNESLTSESESNKPNMSSEISADVHSAALLPPSACILSQCSVKRRKLNSTKLTFLPKTPERRKPTHTSNSETAPLLHAVFIYCGQVTQRLILQ